MIAGDLFVNLRSHQYLERAGLCRFRSRETVVYVDDGGWIWMRLRFAERF